MMTELDGLRMPRRIGFTVYWVNTEVLKKARAIQMESDKYIFSDTEDEYYVLRPNQTVFKKITLELVNKYRKLLTEGDAVYPKNKMRGLPSSGNLMYSDRFEYISAIAQSMRRVIVAEEGTVPVSTAFNPFKLECRYTCSALVQCSTVVH